MTARHHERPSEESYRREMAMQAGAPDAPRTYTAGAVRMRAVDRGMPAPLAVGLALALALISGTIDALTGDGLRTFFAICYIVGSIGAAVLVRRREIALAVIAPPLVYALTALVAAAFGKNSTTSWLSQEFFELATSLVTQFPVLLVATLGAAVVAFVRRVGAR